MKKADLIIASSEHCADLLYACGFRAPDPFIYFAREREKGIIVSALEQDRAEKETKTDIVVYNRADFGQDVGPGADELVHALTIKWRIEEFRVPADFPVGIADMLRGNGIRIVPEKDSFFPQRKYKTHHEIEKITAALRIAEQGMQRAIDILRQADVGRKNILIWDGKVMTSELLKTEINTTLIQHGAMPDATIVACGCQGAEPHNTGSGYIYANQSIIIDIFPRMLDSGYWGDLTRTLIKGEAPEIIQHAFAAVKDARDSAKQLIRPDAIPREIHAAANRVLEEHGFKTGRQDGRNFGFFHGLGHGVGLDIHEKPSLNPYRQEPLKGDEVVTVEPGLYYPDWGGVRLEDIVTVTATGCQCLTEIDTFLEID